MTSAINSLLRAAKTRLAGIQSAGLDAEVLLQHCLGKDRAWLLTHGERELSAVDIERYWQLVQRRAQGEPVAYLTGQREFWSLALQVNPAVLVPRPETELLVERALQHVPGTAAVNVLDLGTGSGAIALAIARERPHCRITATDNAPAALELARTNAHRLGIENISFHCGHWFAAVPAEQRFDLIVSNPPYVEDGDPHLLQNGLPHEPIDALCAGANGLRDLRQIIAGADQFLSADGWLLVEHGAQQGTAVRALMGQYGLHTIDTHQDLASLPRVTEGRKIQSRG